MVEQVILDNFFKSLMNPTRRDILVRVNQRQHTISELAEKYQMSFSAIAKHVNVLEKALLVTKQKCGKEQIITINTTGLEHAETYLQQYAVRRHQHMNTLEKVAQNTHKKRPT